MSATLLSPQQLTDFAAELDALRQEQIESLGEADARYIRSIVHAVRHSELAGRTLLFFGWLPPLWLAGTTLLGLAKILENMELGHNVMHGQYNWMRDPGLHSDNYDWDTVCPAAQWKHSHNYMHHTYTNIVGKDRDVGYGILRLFPEQPWYPAALLQPVYAAALALGFEWGVAFHDLEIDRCMNGQKSWQQVWSELKSIAPKVRRQLLKDYVIFPLLAGPAFIPVLLGNLTANLMRNLWAFGIIFCGHFTEETQAYPIDVLKEERRGAWYYRQLLGSSNIEGTRLFHILSGNLSHQIEHHLFPEIPAWRYAAMAPEVKNIADRYQLPYNTGRLGRQLFSTWKRIFTHALPGRHVPTLTTQE